MQIVHAPHLPIRPEWLALRDEPVLEPALAIVDAHHHLWDRQMSSAGIWRVGIGSSRRSTCNAARCCDRTVRKP